MFYRLAKASHGGRLFLQMERRGAPGVDAAGRRGHRFGFEARRPDAEFRTHMHPAVDVTGSAPPLGGDAGRSARGDPAGSGINRYSQQARYPILHIPMRVDCPACQQASAIAGVWGGEDFLRVARAETCGQTITIDHIVTLNPEASPVGGQASALIFKDQATGWVAACAPVAHKSEEGDGRIPAGDRPEGQDRPRLQ